MGNLLEDNLPDDKPDDTRKRRVYSHRLVYGGIEPGNAVHIQDVSGNQPGRKYGDVVGILPYRNRNYRFGSGDILCIRILPEKRLRRR